MPNTIRTLVLAHWTLANARQWEPFQALLHPDLRYEVPQTREYITSAHGYLDLFRTWPGDWHASVQRLVCEADQAVSVIEFRVGPDVMTGIGVFGVAEGKIVSVTDYWPEPYEPPPRSTPLLLRRPAAA